MKKISVFIIMCAFFVFTFFNAKANETADWEFLPTSGNYLSDDNFTFIEGSDLNKGTIKTLNYIRVKPRTTYYIYVYCYQEVKFTSVKIGMYNSDKEFIANASTNLGNSIITFEAVSNCKYVTLEVGVEEEWGAGMDIHIVENNYYMSDVQVNINGMSEEDLKYKGPSYDYSPVISGYDGYYITDVDDPISLNELLSGVKAIDDVDGDISKNIQVAEDNYSSNMNKVGNYKIVLEATDSSQNTTQFSLNVSVIDTTKPVIEGPITFNTQTTENKELIYFLNQVKVKDNYDGSIYGRIVATNDNYTSNRNTEGTYQVNCYVEDSSKNRTEFVVTIVVKYDDRIKPTFDGKVNYVVNKNEVVTIEEIMSGLKVTDNYDGDVKNKVVVVSDYYSHAPNRVGEWKILLSVSDKAGNETTQEITITVKDNNGPAFFIDKQVINIDLKNNNLEVSDLVNMLSRINGNFEEINYNIVYDEYTDNKDKAGEYKVVLDIEGEPLELKVNVIEKMYKEEKQPLIKKVLAFFTNTWLKIKSLFKRIF